MLESNLVKILEKAQEAPDDYEQRQRQLRRQMEKLAASTADEETQAKARVLAAHLCEMGF